MWESNNLYARLDIAANIMIDAEGDGNEDHALELNVGFGAHVTQSVTLTGEFSSITIFGEDGDGDTDTESIGAFAVGARFRAGSAAPYVALLVPLDSFVEEIVTAGIMLGVDVNL